MKAVPNNISASRVPKYQIRIIKSNLYTSVATITSRRPSQRDPSGTRRSYRRPGGPPSRGGSPLNQEIPEATDNNATDPFSMNRTGSFGKRNMHQADATISEADDEQEEEDNLGSPLPGFSAARRQTTKRLSRSTSARRRCPPPEKMNLKEEIRESVVHSRLHFFFNWMGVGLL